MTNAEQIEHISNWFRFAKDPPKQFWRDILPGANSFKIQTGYIKNQPEFCYLQIYDKVDGQWSLVLDIKK